MTAPLDIAFFGSSLVSSHWNGAATYYRGIVRALAARGHRVTFFEPDAHGRQQHRDIADPEWARVVVWEASGPGRGLALEEAREADVVVKASGVGVFDPELEREVLELGGGGRLVVFWDVDAPATLDRVAADPADPFRALVPRYDLVLTCGGGHPVVSDYERIGARRCVPVYNAFDPSTHHRVAPSPAYACDLAFRGDRLPDSEARVERFFLEAAAALPGRRFLLGGSGWDGKPMPANVRWIGHVPTAEHDALDCSALAVLDISREGMARHGHSPASRVFEAAGVGACLITDAWEGIDEFLAPGREILVARDGAQVADILEGLDRRQAERIGAAAKRRILSLHTYDRRVDELEAVLVEELASREIAA